MKTIARILVTVSVLILSVSSSVVVAKAPKMPDIAFKGTTTVSTTQSEIKNKVYEVANAYNVDGDDMWATILCEDRGLDPNKQSGYYKNGIREESYGLVQINLPSHPDVTYAEATDIDFSINFMAKEFSKGNQRIWTCYKPKASR